VLGRGQIASCLFAGTVVVAIFAGGAYFAGKLSAVNCVAASNSIPQATAPLTVASVVPQGSAALPSGSQVASANPTNNPGATPFTVDSPAVADNKTPVNAAAPVAQVIRPAVPDVSANNEAPGLPPSPAAAAPSDVKSAPLFANPQRGGLYLQVGAVEKGMAMVIAEGLRQHGLASFVAPGPSERIFRVLVGPFATQDEYKRAKAQVDSIDVGNFGRQYEK